MTVSRRRFLAGAGASVMALPWLSALAGDDPERIRRLVIVWTPNGTVMDEFWPHQAEPFGRILEPLAGFKDRMSVLRGIDIESAYVTPIPPDHLPDSRNALTGRQAVLDGQRWVATSESVDQHIARLGAWDTRLRSLELAVMPMGRIIYSGYDQIVPPMADPWQVYSRLFGAPALTWAQNNELLKEHRSMLDVAAVELALLHEALGKEDQPILESHLESLRALEKNLASPQAVCDVPDPGAKTHDHLAPEHFPQTTRLMMEQAALAVGCDLTRVITLQLSGEASTLVHEWADVKTPHHTTAHYLAAPIDEAIESMTRIETWYAQQIAWLCERLDQIPEGRLTALDNTAVVWLHEQQHGASHDRRDMPVVIVGGAAGGLKLAQRIDFEGVPHNQLLVTLCRLMGIPTWTFGDPRFGGGPLPRLLTGL